MAETNKQLCWTEMLAGKEKGKLARIIPLRELRFRKYLTQRDLCLVIDVGFFPMDLCRCLYSAE